VLCGAWVAQSYYLIFRRDIRGILFRYPCYGVENFLFSTAFRPAVGPVQWVSGVQPPKVFGQDLMATSSFYLLPRIRLSGLKPLLLFMHPDYYS